MPVSKKRKKSDPPKEPQQSQNPNKAPIHNSTYATMVGIAVALAATGWMIFGDGPEDATIPVTVPKLSPQAEKGEVTFKRVCIECHGENAGGSKNGPPLINPFYNPAHHADIAFVNAIRHGVRQHHWKFGNMPPQPDVKPDESADLIAYIRELQRANGIY